MVLLCVGWAPGATVHETVTTHAVASRPRDHGARHPLQEPCLSSQEPQAAGHTMAASWDLAEGERTVCRSLRGWALLERQVMGMGEQRIA
jgi:hypothetical protein